MLAERSSEIMLMSEGVKLIQLMLLLRKFLELECGFQKQRVVKVKRANTIDQIHSWWIL